MLPEYVSIIYVGRAPESRHKKNYIYYFLFYVIISNNQRIFLIIKQQFAFSSAQIRFPAEQELYWRVERKTE